MRELVTHAIGGGWGSDESEDGLEQVAVIRGADFPSAAVGDVSGVPVRWESARKIPQRLLQPGDIILEGSGGTSDRPTGRTVFASARLLESIGRPAIPASFCKLVRIDQRSADPYYVYWWLQGMYADGRTWSYQNRSTGIANFQFEHFLDTEMVDLPAMAEQRAIAATLGALDDKI
ncbi:MAG: restriction endonuclease subunit S, partial [Thermoleophilia bacterium]|nr:restriction endonuclease subunit S [Thermoleophilia bacterium]